jgi:hypothetical protein
MMPLRTLVAIMSLFACLCNASAQTTLTTYYVVPPSNGCDGVWAFGPYSALWTSCSGPYTWLFEPAGCVDGSQGGVPFPLNVVNDTIIMDLCSLPCDFLFYGDTGLCVVCICGPLIPTNLPGPATEAIFSMGPNPVPIGSPVLTLNTIGTGTHHVQVLDMAGRSLLQATVTGGRSELDLSGIPAGGYLLLARNDTGRLITQRFQVE